MLKNIFLDLDDTILNFTAGEAKALSQTLWEAGIEPTEAILDRYHIINTAHWELLEEGRLTRDEVLVQRFEQLFRELGVDHSGKAISERYEGLLSCQHDFMPGAEQLLKDLSSRYDLYLASNGAAAVQNPRLDDAGLRPYFKGIFISEEMGADKPSKAFFDACFAAIPGFRLEETVMVGDEAAYPMQSVVKFVLALSVLKRVDQGAMNLEQIIRIRPEQLVKDTWSPLRERFPQGGDFSLKELLRVTVQESDNNTCDLLFGLIGGPQGVQKDLKEWGIDGINVRFTEEEIHRNHDLQYVNSSRPSAMNSLLRAFDEGKILARGTQNFLWGIMAGCSTGPERLKGQLPRDYVVAHKTGSGFSLPGGGVTARNDVGIIVLPNGRKMAVSVFIRDSKDSESACDRVIASMARWLCMEWKPAAGKE